MGLGTVAATPPKRRRVPWRGQALTTRPGICSPVATLGAVLLETAMIAAQPFLNPQRRLVGAGIGVGRTGLGVQRDLRIEMNGALGAKPDAIPRHRDVAGLSTVKILTQCFADACIDALAQRFADVEILARNAKCHGRLRRSASSHSRSFARRHSPAGSQRWSLAPVRNG